MKYARLLQLNDIIGICAPSSGITENTEVRLDKAIENVKVIGYNVIESASVRRNVKCISNDAKTRAVEFMSLYENPDIAAIIPPWGGEFLMDMLPHLDVSRLSELPPKWVCGYSDTSTLAFFLTVCCDIASIHGSNFMNMGYKSIHKSDLTAFESMSKNEIIQHNSEHWGGFSDWQDITKEVYTLDKKTEWKSLHGEKSLSFEGRMIGGCLDTICKLIGTRFAPVKTFLKKYKNDGFIWTLESCEMNAADIYRSLWQMRECGWFEYCKGVLYGRADGYSDSRDFNLIDALISGFDGVGVPIIYDVDIGHLPPQIQIINGSYGTVDYNNGDTKIKQICK